jgi:hypothetical protein
LFAEHPPHCLMPQIPPGQRRRGGEFAAEGVRQEPGYNRCDHEPGRVQMLGDRDVSQGERVVGAVEVVTCAVPEVRSHHRDRAAWAHRVAEPDQHCGYRVLAW